MTGFIEWLMYFEKVGIDLVFILLSKQQCNLIMQLKQKQKTDFSDAIGLVSSECI